MLGAAMAWRQGQSYSEGLRARVLVAVDGGMAARAAASVFRVSVSYIYKALIRRRSYRGSQRQLTARSPATQVDADSVSASIKGGAARQIRRRATTSGRSCS